MRAFFKNAITQVVAGLIVVGLSYFFGVKQGEINIQQTGNNNSPALAFVGNNMTRSPVTVDSHTEIATSAIPLTDTILLSRSPTPDSNGSYTSEFKVDIISEVKESIKGSLSIPQFFTRCDQPNSPLSRPFNDPKLPDIHFVLENYLICYSKEQISTDSLIFFF